MRSYASVVVFVRQNLIFLYVYITLGTADEQRIKIPIIRFLLEMGYSCDHLLPLSRFLMKIDVYTNFGARNSMVMPGFRFKMLVYG